MKLGNFLLRISSVLCVTTEDRNLDVLLTVYLSIFISVINQLDALNFCSWYHHTYRCDDTRRCVMQF